MDKESSQMLRQNDKTFASTVSGFMQRLRRAISWPFITRAAIEETQEAYELLQAKYQELAVRAQEAKQMANVLHDSEIRYRTLVETMDEGVTYIDEHDILQFANGRFCELVGYREEELIGRVSSELLLFPEDREFINAKRKRRKAGISERYEVKLRQKSGQPIWVQVSATPSLDANGNVVGSVGIFTDITGQKRAQEALRESEHFAQTIISSVREGVIVYDHELRYVVWNRFMAELTGLSEDEVIGRSALALFPHLREQGVDKLLERALAGETVRSGDTPYTVPDTGKTGWVIGLYSPLVSITGEIAGVVATVHDITERKRAEEALHKAQKMESLGVMAGGIAHDFNNLLVAILGQTSLALSKLDPNQPAFLHIERAVNAAERAADITRQMLDYAGYGPFVKRPLSFNVLIEENLKFFEVAIPKHVQLQAHLVENLPLIEGDAGQMQQVIMNLLLNGAEAINEPSGQVIIKTGITRLDSGDKDEEWIWQTQGEPLPAGQYVTLEVHDTGHGMNDITLSKIFDPFFTTKVTGRGLGLAAVLGIVRRHGGALKVRSKLKSGTCFQLIFPALVQPQTATPSVKQAQPKSRTGKILVIDDEEAVREAVTDILTMHGLEVVTAPDGAAGVALFGERPSEIQLVLLDLAMPGLNGEETFIALKQIDSDVRVILSSGYGELDVANRFDIQGVAGILQKPYNAKTLADTIWQHLRDG